MTQFTSQLATLQSAGLPIVRSLRILAGQQRPGPFHDAVDQIAQDVEGGDSLSSALAKHDGLFDSLYLNMVKAGEAGGILDEILHRLALFAEKSESIRRKVIGALAYPAFVLAFAGAVVGFVLVFVVPRFEEIFEQLDSTLPPLTLVVLAVADFLRESWWVLLLIVGVLGLAAKLAFRASGVRRVFDRIVLKVPLFGSLASKTIVARFSRTFGTLLGAGVPILDALMIVRDSVTNLVVSDALEAILQNLRQGESMARPMAESPVFDDIVVNMIDVGEESGTVDRMLLKVADTYEQEVDDSVATIFKVVEPLLLLVLAVVVGVVVVALFLPVLKVMDQLAG